MFIAINATANLFSNLLIGTAKLAGMSIKQAIKPKGNKNIRKFNKVKPPKWHDSSCHEAFLKVKATSWRLKNDPHNPWLKGKLSTESKQYKKIIKTKQSQFVNNLFNKLQSLENRDPRGYFNLINAMRTGSFDTIKPGETDSVEPDVWLEHFKNLLGPNEVNSDEIKNMDDFVRLHQFEVSSELDIPFQKPEIEKAIRKLKNNKATGFDSVSNEMLKHSTPVLSESLCIFFNAILQSNIFPTEWKWDILGPLHKSGPLDDPNNFRGICVASCLGKLFNSIMRDRLNNFVLKHNFVHKSQGSGSAGSRTADHLMVLRFLIDKYVKNEKRNLYTCFFDLSK